MQPPPPPELTGPPRRTAAERVGRAALLVGLVALAPLVAVLVVDILPVTASPRAGRWLIRAALASCALTLLAGLTGAATRTRPGYLAAGLGALALAGLLALNAIP